MSGDFATFYISNDLDASYKINYSKVFKEIVKNILSKNVNINLIIGVNKNGKKYTNSFIHSETNNDLHWRIKVNIEHSGNYKRLYLTLSPEFKRRLITVRKDIEDIAIKDIDYFKNKIGNKININVNQESIEFTSFSYSLENKISIKDWNVQFDQTEGSSYADFIDNTKLLLNYIQYPKTFKFRIVNLTGCPNNNNTIKGIIAILEKYGINLNLYYNANDYTKIKTLSSTSEIINIILIKKNDGQNYYDSKEFFLGQNMPFQHIIIDGRLLTNLYAQNMMILEIYKKTHIQDFYLFPDHFSYEPIAGFLYLDADTLFDPVNNNYSNYLTISYIFSQNLNYSEEKLLSLDTIKIHSKRDYMNIIDVKGAVDFILSGNEAIGKYANNSSGNYYFNLIVTKQLNRKSMNSLITALIKKNINVNKIYYVSVTLHLSDLIFLLTLKTAMFSHYCYVGTQ